METGKRVYCIVCRREKAPRGRSVPPSMDMCKPWDYFDPDGCIGWSEPPLKGDLFAGETAEDFGFPCKGD